MTTNKELERMIMNIENAITKVVFSINLLPNLVSGKRKDIDPDTGLRKDFLKLSKKKSLLIEVSTELQKQHCDNCLLERKLRVKEID